MTDLRKRLVRCFELVFPGLSERQIESAHRSALEDWDSLAGLTLLVVVQEEFGMTIDELEWGELDCFSDILAVCEGQRVASANHV